MIWKTSFGERSASCNTEAILVEKLIFSFLGVQAIELTVFERH